MTKDLRIFSSFKETKHILIVDNSTSAFANHIANGIPIIPYQTNHADNELPKLADYLEQLSKLDVDLQVASNKNYFSLEALGHSNQLLESYEYLLYKQ